MGGMSNIISSPPQIVNQFDFELFMKAWRDISFDPNLDSAELTELASFQSDFFEKWFFDQNMQYLCNLNCDTHPENWYVQSKMLYIEQIPAINDEVTLHLLPRDPSEQPQIIKNWATSTRQERLAVQYIQMSSCPTHSYPISNEYHSLIIKPGFKPISLTPQNAANESFTLGWSHIKTELENPATDRVLSIGRPLEPILSRWKNHCFLELVELDSLPNDVLDNLFRLIGILDHKGQELIAIKENRRYFLVTLFHQEFREQRNLTPFWQELIIVGT